MVVDNYMQNVLALILHTLYNRGVITKGLHMKQISVEYDMSTIFSDWIVVDRGEQQKECSCTIEQMMPVMPANAKTYKDGRICATCGNQVRDIMNELYIQYYGYSGYDEV